jgi:hypothetical protein
LDCLAYPILPEYKRHFIKAVIKLSKESKLYPACLLLTGVEIYGDPIAEGAFGVIYKGRYRGQEVAVKALKIFQKSDMDRLLEVKLNALSHIEVD